LALALASACTLKTTDGTDGGAASTPEAGAGTIGDQCTRIYEVLCAKSINTCGQGGFTLDQCVASNKTACCVDKCGSPAISSDSDVTACANAIANESCNDIVNNAKPAACSNVPRTQ
jgi:hypothetical protein